MPGVGIIPALTLGLGVWQAIQGQNAANRAIEEARKPRLSLEAQANLRREGTSNIKSNLASRGLLDSSMLPGGLATLEQKIGEVAAGAGTAGDVPGMLWQEALGLTGAGSSTTGNLGEAYMLNKLLGGQRYGGWNPTGPYQGAPLPAQPAVPEIPWWNIWQVGQPLPAWAP